MAFRGMHNEGMFRLDILTVGFVGRCEKLEFKGFTRKTVVSCKPKPLVEGKALKSYFSYRLGYFPVGGSTQSRGFPYVVILDYVEMNKQVYATVFTT